MEEIMENAIEFLQPLTRSQPGHKNTVGSARQWLIEHDIEFKRFLEDNYTFDSYRDAVDKFFNEDPFLGVQMTVNHVTPNYIKIDALKYLLSRIEFGDIVFIGYYQTGKTAMMFIFAKWLKDLGREVTWFGPPRDLPSWIDHSTVDPYDILTGAVVIFDEVSVRQFCRNAMSKENRQTFENLGTVSHQDQLWLKATQSLRLTDVMNTLLYQMIVAKTMTPAQLLGERSLINDFRLTEWIPFTSNKSMTFIRHENIPNIQFTVEIPLPGWWKSDYSKLFKKIESRDEAERYIRQLFEILRTQGDCLQQIQRELRRMRYIVSEDELCQILGIQR